MSHKRVPKRKAAIAVGGVVALGAAAILLPQANASQDGSSAPAQAAPRTLKAADAPTVASQLKQTLGESYAGAYWDADAEQLVVNVADGDSAALRAAERTGARVRQVENSLSELQQGANTLRSKAAIPGTAWAVDPRTNKIVVTADSTVTGAKWNRLESTVASLGSGMATLSKSAGTFKTFASGGDAIFGGGARCSLGFNVTAGDGSPAFLTAGHCGVAVARWSDRQNGQPIATVDQQTAVFPGTGDFALVKYDDPNTQAPSEVNLGNQTVVISQAADAQVGLQVFRMGSTTGLANGRVLALNATVNYPEGTVTGLIQTNVCAEPGDSGGPLFTRDGLAIGLTSGGAGDCTRGGITFFQPVTTALEATGATLGGGVANQAGGDQGAGNQGVGDQGAGDPAGGPDGEGLQNADDGQRSRRGH